MTKKSNPHMNVIQEIKYLDSVQAKLLSMILQMMKMLMKICTRQTANLNQKK